MSQTKQEEALRWQKKLVLYCGQLQQEVNMQTKAIKKVSAQTTQQLAINEDELRRQVLASMKETRR